MKGSERVNLEGLEAPLRAALERMQALPESSRPFVIVDHVSSGKFVQFCGGAGRPLLFDVPCYGITKECDSLELAIALAVATLRRQGVPSAAWLVVNESHEAAGAS